MPKLDGAGRPQQGSQRTRAEPVGRWRTQSG
jgi:hypothetical protein